MDIYKLVGELKGVGPKAEEKLNKAGIFTILDLLLYFPREYEFLTGNTPFEDILEEDKQILRMKATKYGGSMRTRNGKNMTTIIFDYNGHSVKGIWFNQPYIKKNFMIGADYTLIGKFKKVGMGLEVINPTIGGKEVIKSEIIPKYSLKGELSNKFLIKLISTILDNVKIEENLPIEIVEKYKMAGLDFAIREIHFPKNKSDLERAITRLKFQELFTYSMKLLLLKRQVKEKSQGIYFNWAPELKELKESLPYSLTGAQTRVVREILRDQKAPASMNRLVQGDVGSGKTVVALISIFNVYMNGYKSVLMVPTEILANQHFNEAISFLGKFGVEIELLTGSTPKKEKLRIKERLREEAPLVVIGTHAIIQDDVEINKLGLIVTDEQHRFGVEQRSKLINKGSRADVLVMTATPIPRTLALYVYSDLDISAIDELPPGRIKIDTKFFNAKEREKAYELSLDQLKEGRQVYIVCPLIEEGEEDKLESVEKVYNRVADGVFKDYNVEILHGKMKPSEKDEIINRFKNNETQVLISTTVIEVGVNVPNASVMIIENSERFGLAQLHQLRGRVGRGKYASYCVLVGNVKSKVTEKRMEIMVTSTDGFYIAEQDLKLRGGGEIFGLRQSGDLGFVLADIYEDGNILRAARKECSEILSKERFEDKKFVEQMSRNLERSSKYICFN